MFLKSVTTSLMGPTLSRVVENPFWVVNSVLVVLFFLGFWLKNQKRVCHHQLNQSPYIDFKNIYENYNFYFHSTSMFVK